MTYDVLNKVSKKELIAWLRKNVFLPRISDEQFLRDVKLNTLMEKQEKLLEKDMQFCEQLEKAKGNQFKFMAVLVESQKNYEEIKKTSAEIDKILGVGEHL